MPDWKVTLSRAVIVNGAQTTLETDHVVEGTSRNLAIPMGIDELFKAETAGGYKLVPKEAVDYWDQWRITGGQLYEFQTELEGKWGISFGISQVAGPEDPPPPAPVHRNGHTATAPAGELPDLNSMLERHLKLLTDRQAVLSEELQRKQAEYDRNNADIMRITTMVVTNPDPEAFRMVATDVKLTPSKPAERPLSDLKKLKHHGYRKPKDRPHAE